MNTLFKIVVVMTVLVLSVNPVFAGIEDALVGYYPFNGNANDMSNSTVVYNISPNGTSATHDRRGQPATEASLAVNFNGQSDYMMTSFDLNSSTHPEVTISGWVFPREKGLWGKHQVFTHDDGGHDRSLLIVEGVWTVYVGGNFWNTGRQIALNQWQHVAVVFSSSDVLFIIDGEEYFTYGSPSGMSSGVGSFYIGMNPGTNDEFFDGLIDDIRIYDIAKSFEDIEEIYLSEVVRIAELSSGFDISIPYIFYQDPASGQTKSYWGDLRANPGSSPLSWELQAYGEN